MTADIGDLHLHGPCRLRQSAVPGRETDPAAIVFNPLEWQPRCGYKRMETTIWRHGTESNAAHTAQVYSHEPF